VTLGNSFQLHYLQASPTKARTLVIFLHGFPDSSHIFTPFLRSSSLSEAGALCVALDLPGYGGSDGLAAYGASEMLNAIVEGISKLKDLCLSPPSSDGKVKRQCVLVGHDWGGAIAYRVAAETAGLVDSVVVVNSTHVSRAHSFKLVSR